MGAVHFLRAGFTFPGGQKLLSIEQQLRQAGAKTYLIVMGTHITGGYDDLDHRFDSWPVTVIVSLADNWVGELPALPVLLGGAEGPHMIIKPSTGANAPPPPTPPPAKLKEATDALLYLGPRDSLTAVSIPPAELVGTPYGKEIERRLMIEGFPISFISGQESGNSEAPQFSRPQPQPAGENAPALPPPPKNVGAPLPPRPPSQ